VPAVHPTYGSIAPVYTLGWTLNYEMFFYLVFGLSLVLARPALRLGLFAGLFVLLALAGWMTGPRGAILSTYTNPILLEFLAGVALAALGPWLMRSAVSLGLAALLVAAAWLVFVVLSEAPPGRLVAFGMPAAVIVAGALMLEPIARLRTSRIALLLGDASYSIYLAHPFAQRVWLLAVGLLVPDLGAPVVAALYVSSALLIGVLGGVASYLLLERPLLAAGHRLIGRSSLSRRTMAMESRP
jgi:exopolysaccharide production protein ExoZ